MAKMFLTELMPWNVYTDGIKEMIKRSLGYGYGLWRKPDDVEG